MHPLKITDDYVPTQEAHELRDAENIDPLEQIELVSKVKREGRQDSAISAEMCNAMLEAVPYRRDRQHECALAATGNSSRGNQRDSKLLHPAQELEWTDCNWWSTQSNWCAQTQSLAVD